MKAVVAAPLAYAWGVVARLRQHAFDQGWLQSQALPVPVISVGGLEVGGSGKTPVVGFLLRYLLQRGIYPGLLSRGYGRESRGIQLVAAACQPIDNRLHHLAARIGDEPAMLKHQGLSVPMGIGPSRYTSGLMLLQAEPCDCLVLDDGFGHRRCRRDINIVVLRSDLSRAEARLLPWGRLREDFSALLRANLLWIHHKQLHQPITLPAWLQAKLPDLPHVTSQIEIGNAYSQKCPTLVLSQRRVVAAAGLAIPYHFFASVQATGAQLCRQVVYPDHHRFTEADALFLHQQLRVHDAQACVVSEKDYVKLRDVWPDAASLWALPSRVKLLSGQAHLDALLKRYGMV